MQRIVGAPSYALHACGFMHDSCLKKCIRSFYLLYITSEKNHERNISQTVYVFMGKNLYVQPEIWPLTVYGDAGWEGGGGMVKFSGR